MRVLRVVGEGITTSFRYPHFMQGIHPTFEMPPPATIYGHICSALGEWVSPEELRFAYRFTHDGMFSDVEHIHVVTGSTGRVPGTHLPKALEGNINPFKRAILFRPRLVLYVNKPEWKTAFLSPRYPVVLGRSQDLFTYTDVKVVELVRAERAYLEYTLAPYRMMYRVARGYVELMPRFIDYQHGRRPAFSRYLVINRRVQSDDFLDYEKLDGMDKIFWVDPDSPEYDGAKLGLVFLSLVGDEGEQA